MFSLQIHTGFNVYVSSRSIHSSISSHRSSNTTISCCTSSSSCLRSQQISVEESQSSDESASSWIKKEDPPRKQEDDEDTTKGISGIRVPRQRYISVSKTKLLEALLSMFESQEQIDEFLRLSSCLDSILHAEHKEILEEMRIDYSLTQKDCKTKEDDDEEEKIVVNGTGSIGSMEINGKDDDGRQLNFNGFDLRSLLGSPIKNAKNNSASASRFVSQ